MICCICGKGPANGVSVFRINEKGVPGIWACEQHIRQTDGAPIDPDMRRLTNIIEGKKP